MNANEETLKRTIHDMILNQCRFIVRFWLKQHSRTINYYENYSRCMDSIELLLFGFELNDANDIIKIYDKIGDIYNINYGKSAWDYNLFASDFNDVNNRLAMQMIDMLGGNLYDWFITSFLEKGI